MSESVSVHYEVRCTVPPQIEADEATALVEAQVFDRSKRFCGPHSVWKVIAWPDGSVSERQIESDAAGRSVEEQEITRDVN